MIEMIRLNDHLVRVTGFRRLADPDRALFEVVIQIPGEAAEQLFAPLLQQSRLTLDILQSDAEPERHDVILTDHQLHVAGPPHARLYRHQLRLEAISPETATAPLDAAGVVSRDAVERRARELGPG